MDTEVINYLEGLAKVKIDDSKRELYAKQIGDILNYIKEVQSVDTSSVEAGQVNDGTPQDVYKGDIVLEDAGHREMALKNAPESQNGYYKVSQVIKQ